MKITDGPMFYDIEIEELKTKKVGKTQVACWWSDAASISGFQIMCDCQMAGYCHAKPIKTHEGTSWMSAFAGAQHDYRKASPCTCEKPSKKFRALRAHLPSGAVIEIAA